MPFYTFKCPECKGIKEVMQAIKDPVPTCEKCSKMVPRHLVVMERVWQGNGPSIKFKGEGFYETDYKKPQLSVTSGGKKVKLYDTPEEAQERAEDAAKKAEDTE